MTPELRSEIERRYGLRLGAATILTGGCECRVWRVASSPLMQEVAWAAWEFAKAPAGDDLQVERAHIFLASYRDAGGPCREDEYAQAIPFIRLRLCDEIRRNLAAADRGEPWDRDYTEQEIRAFQRLRGITLVL